MDARVEVVDIHDYVAKIDSEFKTMMGLGKTLQSIALLAYLHAQKNLPGPFLVLCPLSVTEGWAAEFARFAPHMVVLKYTGSALQREDMRQMIVDHINTQPRHSQSTSGGDDVPTRSPPCVSSPQGTPFGRLSVDRSPSAALGLLGGSPLSGGPDVRTGKRRRGDVSPSTSGIVAHGLTHRASFPGLLGASPPAVPAVRNAIAYAGVLGAPLLPSPLLPRRLDYASMVPPTPVWSHAVPPSCPRGRSSVDGGRSDVHLEPGSRSSNVGLAAASFGVPPESPSVASKQTPRFDDDDSVAAVAGTPSSAANNIVRVCVRDVCRRRLYALRDAMASVGDNRGPVSDVVDRPLHWSLPAIRAEFGASVATTISSTLPSRVCGKDFQLHYLPGDSGGDYVQGGSHGSGSATLGGSQDGSQNSFPSSRRVSQRSDRGRGRPRRGRREGWNGKVVRQGLRYCELAIETVMRRGEPVTLIVDGRYDSARGAQHCTVTAMEYGTRLVVGVMTLRPKTEGKASSALEVPAVVRLLRGLLEKGLKIWCMVSDDCAALGPQLRALNIDWQKDCHHKIKNIHKHFRSMLQLKEAKKVSNPHECVSEAQFMQFTKKQLVEALYDRFGLGVLTAAEERMKKSDFVGVVMKKMCPFGSRTNVQELTADPNGVTESHAHEVGMWFFRACQLCKEEGGDARSLHRDIMLIADHWAGDHSGCVDGREVMCEKAGGPTRLPLYRRTDRVYGLVQHVMGKQCSTNITTYYVEFRHTSPVETFQGTIIIYAKKSVHFEKSYSSRVAIAVIRWNSHCWRAPVGYRAHIPAGTSIRPRPAFRRQNEDADNSWMHRLAAFVFGLSRVSDWARKLLQQEDCPYGAGPGSSLLPLPRDLFVAGGADPVDVVDASSGSDHDVAGDSHIFIVSGEVEDVVTACHDSDPASSSESEGDDIELFNLYELAVFDPSDPILDPMWRQGMFVIPKKDPCLPFHVLLTTYELAMVDAEFLSRFQWRYVIIDEAQRLKNPNSVLYQALMTQYMIPRRLLLTGTPVQNNLTELWALLHFCMPRIFSDLDGFLAAFTTSPEEVRSSITPSKVTGSDSAVGYRPNMVTQAGNSMSVLRKILESFMCRRTKAELIQANILTLPPLTSVTMIWDVERGSTMEGNKVDRDGYDPALMGIMGDEEEELRRLLDNQPPPPPPPGGEGMDGGRNRNNGFVPIASAQWVEEKARRQQDRVWVQGGFNHLAPINIKGWKFLADLSKSEVEECRRKALTGILDYANNTPHCGGKLTFPTLSELDPTKCVYANPVVMQKMITSSLSLDIKNLRKLWNVGRSYLKCRCGFRNARTCNGGPIWFDHAIWFLLAKLEIVKPEAGSNRVRIAFLLHHLRNSWRELAKASVTFIWMREVMLTVLRNLERNPELMIVDALTGSTFKTHACPKILANLILPTRITSGIPAPQLPNPKKRKNRSPMGAKNKRVNSASPRQQTLLNSFRIAASPVSASSSSPASTASSQRSAIVSNGQASGATGTSGLSESRIQRESLSAQERLYSAEQGLNTGVAALADLILGQLPVAPLQVPMALELGRRIPEILRVEYDPDIFLPWPPAGPTMVRIVRPNVWEAQRSSAQPAIALDNLALADILTAQPQITTIAGIVLAVEYKGVIIGEIRSFGTRTEEGRIGCDTRLRGVSGDGAFPGKQTGVLWPAMKTAMGEIAFSVVTTLDFGDDTGEASFYGFGRLFGPDSDYWGTISRGNEVF
ncbi:hypothetical protein CBR_g48847 [Chara braunii]|uniref:Helicase ATP-binding domain-containing protein n=1 Tax=Chara braunii TaxID=69332 RepID=A0A388M3H7_CHABU|nr:hypothetical protein CBR_g48847 [Chara braunii]|eukprot:GBG89140.1 hypothetical protein CBR_g48847 [Chara braunii]